MNNRILAALFALAVALFISVAPVKAEAATHTQAHTPVDANGNCVCDYTGCNNAVHHLTKVAKVEANHEKAGNIEYYVCSACGKWFRDANAQSYIEKASDVVIPVVEHDLQWEVKDGTHKQYCTGCGYVPVAETAHTLSKKNNGDGTHTIKCTVEGCTYEVENAAHDDGSKKDHVCGVCGAEMTHTASEEWSTGDVNHWKVCTVCKKELEKTAHTKEWIIDEEEGTHKKVCTVCGEVFHGLQEHTYGTAVVNEDGTHTIKCTTCNYEKTEAHYDEDETCKCDVCYTPLEHKYDEWSKDKTGHWFACTNENCEFADANKNFAAHDYVRTELEGDQHKTECKTCGFVMGTYDCEDAANDDDCVCDGCGGTMDHTKLNLKNTGRFTVVHKTATCTEDGIWLHYQCNFCGIRLRESNGKIVELTEETMVNPAKGHKLVWNHGNAGHYQVCENEINGKQCEYKTEIAEHSYVYTDNGNGTHDARCSVCNRGINDEKHTDSDTDNDCICDGAGCGHEMNHVRSDLTYHARKEATCLTDGNKGYFTCNTCNGVFTGSDAKGFTHYDEDYTLKALGHDWNFLGIANDLHWAKCIRCGVQENLAHSDTDGDCLCDLNGCGDLVHSHRLVFVAEVAPTCDEEGTEAYYYYSACGKKFDLDQKPITAPATIPATGHTAGTAWEAVDGDVHAKKCVNCGEVMETAAHADSNNDNRCDVCGVELVLNHVAQVDPTCTDKGYEEYWVSGVTGRKYADALGTEYISSVKEIPALGHAMSAYTSNGQGGHEQYCEREGCTYRLIGAHTNQVRECFCDTCAAPMPGHEVEVVEAVAATCEKSGTQAYVKCSCGNLYDALTGEVITAPAVVKATGHVLGTNLVEDTKAGEHYKVCTNDGCDKRFYEEHAPVLEDPLKGNYHQWVCECGNVKTEVHYDKDGDKKCDECKHDMANTSVKVEQHDPVTVITGEKETVDNNKSWWQNWLNNLLPGTSGGADTSKPSTSGSGSTSTSGGSTSAPSGNTSTSGGNASTSGGSTSAPSGSTSGSGSSDTNPIGEFFQWLAQLFNAWLQGK